jgi:hypothetical protein
MLIIRWEAEVALVVLGLKLLLWFHELPVLVLVLRRCNSRRHLDHPLFIIRLAVPGELIIGVRSLASDQFNHIIVILAIFIIQNEGRLFLPWVICQPDLVEKLLLQPLAGVNELIGKTFTHADQVGLLLRFLKLQFTIQICLLFSKPHLIFYSMFCHRIKGCLTLCCILVQQHRVRLKLRIKVHECHL